MGSSRSLADRKASASRRLTERAGWTVQQWTEHCEAHGDRETAAMKPVNARTQEKVMNAIRVFLLPKNVLRELTAQAVASEPVETVAAMLGASVANEFAKIKTAKSNLLVRVVMATFGLERKAVNYSRNNLNANLRTVGEILLTAFGYTGEDLDGSLSVGNITSENDKPSVHLHVPAPGMRNSWAK